jgi:hypothetical protein
MNFHKAAALALSFACGFVSSAQSAPQEFAVLAGAAVTCTTSTVNGNVGLANPGTITNTGCAINGATEVGNAAAQDAYAAFLGAYANLRSSRRATSTMCLWPERFSRRASIAMTRR